MRPWIALLLTAGSMAAAVRHIMGHRHPILIPMLLVPALVLGWMEWQWRADQAEFSAIATEIAGRPVTIECQRFSGALTDVTGELGYVQFDADGSPSDTGRLERTACNDLRDFLDGDHGSPTLEQVVAVQVLAHEAYHLAGIRNEAETECKAMQVHEQTAVRLGASPTVARQMVERYAEEIYPHMPTAYRTGDCVEGGLLDLTPDDQIWP